MKIVVALLVAVFVAAPAAAGAGGPPQYALQFGAGVTGKDGTQYVALGYDRSHTLLTSFRHGQVWGVTRLRGSYGIPLVTLSQGGGLSRDGRTLFLQSVGFGSSTHFVVVDTRFMQRRDRFALHGDFSFDALSPDASRLYLIQRVDEKNSLRYVVRAYDLASHRLLPGRIADRTQKGWVMQGSPVARGVTGDGRWVYTLYSNQGGFPFIHALDTVRGVAHCVGLPWPQGADQGPLQNLVLDVRGRNVDVRRRSGRTLYRLDTAGWRMSPVRPSGFPWQWPVLGAATLVLVAGLGRRRRRRAGHIALPSPYTTQGGEA